jgi:20S proteasome subunit alpha 2
MQKHFWRRGDYNFLYAYLSSFVRRYNDDISLEDAIHTALLTLKEGFEGQMTERTIEIGVVTVPSPAELEQGNVSAETGRPKPTFRKLTEEEVRDYLAL